MRYAKAGIQAIGAILTFILSVMLSESAAGETVTLGEWCQVSAMSLGVLPIVLIPNTRYQEYAKGIVSALVAVLGLLPVLLDGGIVGSEWVQIILAFGTAAGVILIPNSKDQQRELA